MRSIAWPSKAKRGMVATRCKPGDGVNPCSAALNCPLLHSSLNCPASLLCRYTVLAVDSDERGRRANRTQEWQGARPWAWFGVSASGCQNRPADLWKLPKKAYFPNHLWILTLRNPIPLPASALRCAAPSPNLDKFETATCFNNLMFRLITLNTLKIRRTSLQSCIIPNFDKLHCLAKVVMISTDGYHSDYK